MRYLAKSEEGRTVGEGRTIITAVNRAKKRGGVYVVDDKTGAIQWRRPEAAKPKAVPFFERRGNMVYGEDKGPGTAPFFAECENVETAAIIVRAVNSHAALVEASRRAEAGTVDAIADLDAVVKATGTEDFEEVRNFLVSVRDEARAALRLAAEEA